MGKRGQQFLLLKGMESYRRRKIKREIYKLSYRRIMKMF
jgi:hypothetical protein